MIDINESFANSGSDVKLSTTTKGDLMTTTQENIHHRLQGIVAEHLGVKAEDVEMGKRFAEDFGADSLDMVELVMALEEEFGLADIDDETVRRVNTVEDAVILIEKAEKREEANA